MRWSATSSTELGHLGTSGGLAHTRTTGINNSGVAIGAAAVGTGASAGVRWNGPGTAATPVQAPEGFTAAVLQDINSAGTIIGMGALGGGTRPFRWSASGTPTPLAQLPGYVNTETYDINDAGAALGRAFTGFNDRAVRWDAAGTISELGHLGLSSQGTTTVFPRTLNSAGTAVGYAFKHDVSGNYQGTVPVRWESSGAASVELESPVTLTGMQFGDARALNDNGVAVGYVQKSPAFPGDDFGSRAARWESSGTAVSLLGTLGVAPNGEGLSDALAINSSGLIVGTATMYNEALDFSEFRAVYWQEAVTPVDLNTLIDPASGWVLTHAYSVSDTGWIAGDGFFDPDGPGGQDAYGRHFLLQLAAQEDGDFNNDGSVDAADYVVWRRTDGTQEGYDAWRANFGRTPGSGAAGYPQGASAESLPAAIPEPSALALAAVGVFACLAARKCRWAPRSLGACGRRAIM